MSVQRTLKIISKITIVANEGFFPSMHHDMSFHIPLVLHKLTANRTPKLPCSNSNWFNLQNKQTKKSWKKKEFLYSISISWNSMNISNMWITMASASKSPWAVVTWVWFLPSMNPNMLFHIALILHNLIAKRTFVLSCSKPNWFNLQNKQTEKVEKNKSNSLLFHQHFNSMNISNMRVQIARMGKSF